MIEVIFLLYPYATFPGHLIVTFSQVIRDSEIQSGEKVFVHFEQPDDKEFKEARYTLPDYKLVYNDGFLPQEQNQIEDILQRSAKLIWKYARLGGVRFD